MPKKDDGWHPYGNIDPYKAPKTADQLLNEFFDIAKGLGLVSFLWQGTCLGLVRDGTYIKGDNDIDVGILKGIEELTEALIKNGFERKSDHTTCRHFLKYGILLDVSYIFHNMEFIRSPGIMIYKDRNYYIPDPITDYLKSAYGDWRTPRHREVW